MRLSQRADHTARRKAIYETLYPETQHGANASDAINQRWGNTSPQVEDSYRPSFTESTAEATGRSRQAVERDAQRFARARATNHCQHCKFVAEGFVGFVSTP